MQRNTPHVFDTLGVKKVQVNSDLVAVSGPRSAALRSCSNIPLVFLLFTIVAGRLMSPRPRAERPELAHANDTPLSMALFNGS